MDIRKKLWYSKEVLSKTDGRCCMTERMQERKVRASKGRVPDNVRRRRLQRQCNRNKPHGNM